MNKINDGGFAFPVWELNGNGQPEMTGFGMSLRVIEARGEWENCHSVPADVIERKRSRWESVDAEDCVTVVFQRVPIT